MRRTALVLVSALTSCSATPSQGEQVTLAGSQVTSQHISGQVLDGSGQPIKAHIALITENGSQSMGTGSGTFHFNGLRTDEYVLTAWTDDGRWTWIPRVTIGTEGLVLTPDQAGAYVNVTMTGRKTARFAVFHDGIRFADRTVRDGKPMRFLVPAGDTSYLLYVGYLERTLDLHLAAGESEALRFDLTD